MINHFKPVQQFLKNKHWHHHNTMSCFIQFFHLFCAVQTDHVIYAPDPNFFCPLMYERLGAERKDEG